jgi:subtilisin-like proprotein convertase family protein/membrane-bound inhibitor of C-type lysozyme
LWVFDDTPGDSGQITNGWSLGITTLPVITGLADLVTPKNVPTNQTFTVVDDAPNASFTGTATSANQALVGNTNLSVTIDGNRGTVSVIPNRNASGEVNITVHVTNADGQTVSQTFKLTILEVNGPPTLAAISDQTVLAGTAGRVPLVFSDPETANNELSVTATSDNKGLIPDSGLKVVGTNLFVSPLGNQAGTARITVTVKDPQNAVDTKSFLATVHQNPGVFANTTSMTIPTSGRASLYPSRINVAGLGGTIVKVTATLVGLQHSFPSDLSVLLVNPQGDKAVIIMSNAGGSVGINNARIMFDDAAPTLLPQLGQITDGSYKPTDYRTTDAFLSPAPQIPYSATLNVFNGADPNGEWALYVQDEASPDSGSLTGGWFLTIETSGPSIAPIGAQTVLENGSIQVPVTVSAGTGNVTNLVTTATLDSEEPAGLIGKFLLTGDGANRVLDIRPSLNMPSLVQTSNGVANFTVTLTDGAVTNTVSFPLTVVYVDQPTVITGLTNVATVANLAVSLPFTIEDPDSTGTNLLLTATASRESGVVALVNDGQTGLVTFTPNNNLDALGETVISVVAAGQQASVTNSFVVTVTAAPSPVISAVQDQVLPVDGSVVISFTVDNVTPNLQVLALVDTTNVVSNVAINGSGSTWTATVNTVPGATGTAQVTLFAGTEWGSATEQFAVSVIQASATPVISAISDVTTRADAPVTVTFTVTDPDSTNIVVQASANRSTGTIVVSGTPAAQTLTFTPNNAIASLGDTVITVTATDGETTASEPFTVKVTAGQLPVISAIADQTVPEGGTLIVNFTVSNITQNMAVVGQADDTNVVASVAVSGEGTNYTATVTLAAGATNGSTATVTVLASTDWGNAVEQFLLTVTGEVVPPPQLEAGVTGGQLTVGFVGLPNTQYGVLASSNLADWTEVSVVTTDANGKGTFTTPASGTGTFYRVQQK